jgi:hypothetical protein
MTGPVVIFRNRDRCRSTIARPRYALASETQPGSTVIRLSLARRSAVHGEYHPGDIPLVVRHERHRGSSHVMHLTHALHGRHTVRTIAADDYSDLVL